MPRITYNNEDYTFNYQTLTYNGELIVVPEEAEVGGPGYKVRRRPRIRRFYKEYDVDGIKEFTFLKFYSVIGTKLIPYLRDFKIQMPEDMINEWKNLIIKNSIMVEPTIKIDIIDEDPNDNKFLEAAITGNVDIIISQDKHLLKLKEYEEIKIIKPEEAFSIL